MIIYSTILSIIAVFFPSILLAATEGGVTLENPLKADSIQGLIADLLDIVIQVGLPILVLVFVWIGFKFVMARGNPDEINAAKKWFLFAVIGAAIVLGAYVIAAAIQGTINQIKS